MITFKNLITSFAIIFIVSCLTVSAATDITSDTVYGQWTKAGSPYYILQDITIPYQETLVIDPGVEVIFKGYYELEVDGSLLAIGTAEDSIFFTRMDTAGLSNLYDTTGGWHGLRFALDGDQMKDPGSSELVYCQVKHSKAVTSDQLRGGGISIGRYPNLIIDHCSITKNYAQNHGGGISMGGADSRPIIKNSYIAKNKSGTRGGGIYLLDCYAIIYNNKIVYNESVSTGGGLTSEWASNKYINNIIANNYVVEDGGGIYLWGCGDEVFGNLIVNNSAGRNGGGIGITGGNNNTANNTIAYNEAQRGAGIGFDASYSATLGNNIIWKNKGTIQDEEIYIPNSTIMPRFSNCIIEGGTGGIYVEPGNEYFGTDENILDLDPMFTSEDGGSGMGTDWKDSEWEILNNSPALNRGVNDLAGAYLDSSDYTGANRLYHGIIDIGANEVHISRMEVSGRQPHNTIWMADSIMVTDSVFVADDSTLIITAGSNVIFQGHYDLDIQGTILARGTASQPIVFTIEDNAGFDNYETNDGAWRGIIMDNGADGANAHMTDNDTSIFEYCVIEYAKDLNPGVNGGALRIHGFSNLIVRNCIIRNNIAWQGGGICLVNSNAVIMNNRIYNNIAKNKSGGLRLQGCPRPIIIGNIISNNLCLYYGNYPTDGGVTIISSSPVFQNNIVCNNESLSSAGGIGIKKSSLEFANNIIAFNKSPWAAGAWITSVSTSFYNSIFWGNTANDPSSIIALGLCDIDFMNCNIENGIEGFHTLNESEYRFEGVITSDPGFISPPGGAGLDFDGLLANWSIHDFSELINAGLTDIPGDDWSDIDFTGNPRVNGGLIDIGPCENTTELPVITSQPVNKTVCEGDSIVLSVEATGSAKFQWVKDGENIAGADTSLFIINSVRTTDEANYSCFVYNGYGEVNTNNVFVQVKQAPEILIQTESQWINKDEPLRLEVYPSGTPPLSFQWSKDGSIIPGAVSAAISISKPEYSDEGRYSCVIENSCKSITSEPVDIYAAPQICMVTVSPTTGHNLVIWEKKSNAPVESYIVYRESVAAGIYDRLATIPKDELSVFVDTIADPTVQAYLYKITALDTGMVETDIDLCEPHKTIHLIVTTNPELKSTQLQWDRYYGFDYQTTKVYRSATGLNFDPVHTMSASLNSWTDPDPSTGDLFYRIAVEKPDPCVPEGSGKKAGTGPYQHTLSNMDDNKLKSGQLPPDTITLSNNWIHEDSDPGKVIGKLVTTDRDSLDSHTYKFTAGEGDNDNSSFTIVGDLLMSSGSFDYHTQAQYKIRIRSTDEAGNYCEVPFLINVIPTGYDEIRSGSVMVFPNPFSQTATITFPNPGNESFRLTLTDLSGKVCRIEEGITTSEYLLKKADLNPGIYFLNLRGPNTYRGKIIIE